MQIVYDGDWRGSHPVRPLVAGRAGPSPSARHGQTGCFSSSVHPASLDRCWCQSRGNNETGSQKSEKRTWDLFVENWTCYCCKNREGLFQGFGSGSSRIFYMSFWKIYFKIFWCIFSSLVFTSLDPDPYGHFWDPKSGFAWKLMRIRNTGLFKEPKNTLALGRTADTAAQIPRLKSQDTAAGHSCRTQLQGGLFLKTIKLN